jgi:DinB superfamily
MLVYISVSLARRLRASEQRLDAVGDNATPRENFLRDRLELLLRAFDDAWSHRLESLTAALRGVTDSEAVWQHPCYGAVEGWPGMPPPGTILWQIAHLEHSARHYNFLLLNRSVSIQPQTPPPEATNLEALLHALDASRTAFRRSIAALSDACLDEPCFDAMNVEEFLSMAIQHETVHAGQMVIARRLYRGSRGPNEVSDST